MEKAYKKKVHQICQKYFGLENLPIVFYYTDDVPPKDRIADTDLQRCVMANFPRVLDGEALYLNGDNIGCTGGKYYLGFSEKLTPGIEFFLSWGETGKTEGEKLMKSPELVRKQMALHTPIKSPGEYIVFKRWDKIDNDPDPLGVIFFARTDLLSGLLMLANFESSDNQQVISPSCAGCASITYYPHKELLSDNPRAVLGMFDITARPYLSPDILTFAIPWPFFLQMMENAGESFLTRERWNALRQRT